jgi:hypothetical protein
LSQTLYVFIFLGLPESIGCVVADYNGTEDYWLKVEIYNFIYLKTMCCDVSGVWGLLNLGSKKGAN